MEEKKKFVVTMSDEDSTSMEKAWYEYNASRDIASFIMQQENVNFDTLQEYLNIGEMRFIKSEKLKEAYGKKYLPEGEDISKLNYGFDFEQKTITYSEP